MKSGGVFEITTPQHLLEKATHDIERLRTNHLDAYAAFDFFVTARHIPNWIYPNDSVRVGRNNQRALRRMCDN